MVKTNQAMMDVLKIKRSPIANLLGQNAVTDAESLYEMLDRMGSTGVGPKRDSVHTYSPFFCMVIKRLEFFCRVPLAKSNDDSKDLVGKMAVGHSFKQASIAWEEGVRGKPMMQLLKPIKTFGWLLEDADYSKFREMLAKNAASVDGPQELCDGNEKAIVAASSCRPSAAADADECDRIGRKPTKRQSEKESQEAAAKSKVMRFFGGGRG